MRDEATIIHIIPVKKKKKKIMYDRVQIGKNYNWIFFSWAPKARQLYK
jgi:hypothetical protein